MMASELEPTLMICSSAMRTVTSSSAFRGILKLGLTLPKKFEAGSPLSRAKAHRSRVTDANDEYMLIRPLKTMKLAMADVAALEPVAP